MNQKSYLLLENNILGQTIHVTITERLGLILPLVLYKDLFS